jgi:LuxR family transcriptional regulator, maltose regulon positive regulatory protein
MPGRRALLAQRPAAEQGAADDRTAESAFDLAEPDGALFLFLLDPAPDLLKRHARQRATHGAIIAEILSLLAGQAAGSPPGMPQPPLAPLSRSEIRVLRYLPTSLSMPEIANELPVSHNTVRTHMRHMYAKLGTHRRADTVARARGLGLLAPFPAQGPGPVLVTEGDGRAGATWPCRRRPARG